MFVILSLHSLWRWIVLALAAIAILKALIGWLGNQDWTALDERLSKSYTMAFSIQFLLGFVLYLSALSGIYTPIRYLPPSNVILRLSTEHVLLMVIALVIAIVFRSRARKATQATAKHRAIAIGFLISLIIVAISIPVAAWSSLGWYL